MREQEPSRTALAAAAYRAVHQVLDQGRIFADPLAVSILGDHAERFVRDAEARPSTRAMRLFIAARSRVAEAALKAGVEQRNVSQLVVLGAGLDTFAYRNPFEGALRVFEVDHPATQAWKRRRLQEVGIAVPASLNFTAVDFERDSLLVSLEAAGLDPQARTFFTWLGVVPYLTQAAVSATLGLIGGLAGGGEVVFDYSDPPASLPDEARAWQKERAARVAAVGEPFLSYFEPAALHAQLESLGFGDIDDLGPQALIERYFRPGAPADDPPSDGPPRDGPPRERGGHVIFAGTPRGDFAG